MPLDTYRRLPAFLPLREVRVHVNQRGFRTRSLVIVTTLLSPEEYAADDLADLYRRRWDAELNLRSIKIVLQMDQLRCKTPHRVRNEFWMHLLAYNLIRRVMALAAKQSGRAPWQISFKGALQTVNQFLPLLGFTPCVEVVCQALVDCIAADIIGNRPDRFEPRVTKRRPRSYCSMTRTRGEYKSQMA